jgi:hypothetical protein
VFCNKVESLAKTLLVNRTNDASLSDLPPRAELLKYVAGSHRVEGVRSCHNVLLQFFRYRISLPAAMTLAYKKKLPEDTELRY